jgi:hypothetical protein
MCSIVESIFRELGAGAVRIMDRKRGDRLEQGAPRKLALCGFQDQSRLRLLKEKSARLLPTRSLRREMPQRAGSEHRNELAWPRELGRESTVRTVIWKRQ